MSRTYRRKNYEVVYPDRFAKRWFPVGEATQHYEYGFIKDNGYHGRCYSIVQKTKKELIREKIFRHGDNHTGEFSVPSDYTKYIERKLRTRNKRELYNYMNKEEYEPMCIEKYTGAGWSYW